MLVCLDPEPDPDLDLELKHRNNVRVFLLAGPGGEVSGGGEAALGQGRLAYPTKQGGPLYSISRVELDWAGLGGPLY